MDSGPYIIQASTIYSGDPDDLDPNIQGTTLKGNIRLLAGWNLISLPLIPQSSLVSVLFPKAKVIYGYEKGIGYVRINDEK